MPLCVASTIFALRPAVRGRLTRRGRVPQRPVCQAGDVEVLARSSSQQFLEVAAELLGQIPIAFAHPTTMAGSDGYKGGLGVITGAVNRAGRSIDLAIAATANVHRVPLLTTNTSELSIISDLIGARDPSALHPSEPHPREGVVADGDPTPGIGLGLTHLPKPCGGTWIGGGWACSSRPVLPSRPPRRAVGRPRRSRCRRRRTPTVARTPAPAR